MRAECLICSLMASWRAGMAPNAKFLAEVAAALSDKAEPIIVVRCLQSLPKSWTSHTFANNMLQIHDLSNNAIAIA